MKIAVRIILWCTVGALLAAPTLGQKRRPSQPPFHTSGIYSNITLGEGGDLGGMEIFLTDSDNGFYATVQIAEGVLGVPRLIKVQGRGLNIEFTLPSGDGSRKFTGKISAAGVMLYESGEGSFLKRKCYR